MRLYFLHRICLLLILAAGLVVPVAGQPIRTRTAVLKNVYTGEPVFLAYWIESGSIIVKNGAGNLSNVETIYNAKTGELTFQRPDGAAVQLGDVTVQYRALPMLFPPLLYPVGYIVADQTSTGSNSSLSRPVAVSRPDPFGNSQLYRNGSITRGIITGTRRDFAIESGLRFELSGKLSDDVTLYATLTDQSTPIQPEGSTQNIREFDQVLIKVTSPDATVQMGDVDINLENGEFGRLRRRLQGAQASYQNGRTGANAGIAVPRGKFRTQQFNGADGVQGPYRLTGASGEAFIVILAASENVYIDGIKMERGEDRDYVIDYGLGEIRFTPRRMITAFSRITVDFQYQDTEFARTLTAAQGITRWGSGKFFAEATAIREADNDDLTATAFSEEDRKALQQAGNVTAVPASGVRPATPADIENGAVLYTKKDSVLEGQHVRFYQPTSQRDVQVFVIRFGKTAPGEGSYQRTGEGLNGITYRYTGPGTGDYDTLRILRPPSANQMVVVRGGFEDGETFARFEVAGSQFLGNRLSGASASLVPAYNADLQWSWPVSKTAKAGVFAKQRYSDAGVVFFDRTLDVEFARKWDVATLSSTPSKEIITNAGVFLELQKHLQINANRGWYGKGTIQSSRIEYNFRYSPGKETVAWYKMERIRSEDTRDTTTGRWIRHLGELSKPFTRTNWIITPRVYVESENRQRDSRNMVSPDAFAFTDIRPGINLLSGDRFSAGFSYGIRPEFKYPDGTRRMESLNRTMQFQTDLKPVSWYAFEGLAGFRKRDFTGWYEQNREAVDSDGIQLRGQQTLRPFNSGLYLQTVYEAGTERRARLQETYGEIGPELGQYVWTDLNGDGVQQIAEFFPEQTPNEGTFVKQWVPSDQLFPVIALNTRTRFKVEPQRIPALKNTIVRWVVLESTIDLRETSTTEKLEDVYLLKLSTFQDTASTLQGRIAFRHQMILFPNHRKGELTVTTETNRALNNQASGAEQQDGSVQRVQARMRISDYWSGQLLIQQDRNSIESAAFDSRNFDISGFRIEPGLTWQPGTTAHLAMTPGYASKNERIAGAGVKLWVLRSAITVQMKNGLHGTASITGRNTIVNGEPSANGLFELTEGAGAGKTLQWALQAAMRVNTTLRASLTYDGRTVTNQAAIHTVRVVVSAIF
jgi:hypothetical protein